MEQSKIIVRVATSADFKYAQTITDEMATSAQARGTGIAKRSTEYIQQKMKEGKAVIAVTEDNLWVGFCYIEAWGKEDLWQTAGLLLRLLLEKQESQKISKKEYLIFHAKNILMQKSLVLQQVLLL